ncbi:MAG: 2-iminobutanoate/2-iminopropanoate deaminase [Blastocatellia bacterium]|nr:2-iminobutanoate/2-iminopropanoate deaminase [Blastocatellia bacterium]
MARRRRIALMKQARRVPILSVFLLKYRVCLGSENQSVLTVKNIIATDHAPRAIGPYSQAVQAGDLVFASGQIPIDPATGEFVAGGIAEQTEQVLRNLTAVFEAAGVELNQVVKTTVFLADMDDFTAMNEVYGRFFGDAPPARATVQAARLPRDARVEIEAIAVVTGTRG